MESGGVFQGCCGVLRDPNPNPKPPRILRGGGGDLVYGVLQ